MTASAHNCPTALDLTHEEAWALHAALLDRVRRTVEEGEDPARAVSLLGRFEEGDDFERDELEFLAEVLREYADGPAPSRDKRPAEDAIDGIRTTLA